jgi:transcriptional regulator with XRE-family HTH domain
VLADRLTVSRKWVNEIEQGNSNAKLGLVMRALNELGIDLYGQTSPTETGAKARLPDEIDIDAIADMSLSKKGRR